MFRKLLSLAAALLAVSAIGAPASAQSVHNIRVGKIESAQTCEYFREYSFAQGTYATPWLYASATSLRSWIVKDCQSDFTTLRSSLEAALASSPYLTVSDGGYVVDVTLTQVSDGGPAPAVNPGSEGYAFSSAWMTVSMSVTLRDASGNGIYGGNLTKKVETGYRLQVDGQLAAGSKSAETAYGMLQNEVAQAAARIVSFEIEPLRVVTVDGTLVELNYGGPLLTIGSVIQIDKAFGISKMKYRVVSTSNRSAVADMDGDYQLNDIRPGANATFVDDDDPAANARRYQRVRLP
jgi:hypothetical protein